jgi:hypothetical protein
MDAASSELGETQPVPDGVLEMAREAVRDFHECFWWWNPDFAPRDRKDIREIIITLRKSGGHRAWHRAQQLQQCL